MSFTAFLGLHRCLPWGLLCLSSLTSLPAQVAFPKPSGRYAVGTTTLHLVDEKRKEHFTLEPDDQRELVVQLWYPAKRGAKGKQVEYLPHFDLLRRFLNQHFRSFETKLDAALLPALVDAAPLSGKRLPLVLFSTGLGTARLFYANQLLELASHGYLVAAVDHTYDCEGVVFPGPRLVERLDKEASEAEKGKVTGGLAKATPRLKVWAQDLSFVLDRVTAMNKGKGPFAKRVDLKRVGLLGHCYGGEAAMLAASLDPRIKAVANQNGWPPAKEVVERGLTQPCLLVWGQETTAVKSLRKQGVKPADMRKLIEAFRGLQVGVLKQLETPVWHAELTAFEHMDFTDLPALAKWLDAGKKAGPTIEYPPRVLSMQSYTREFFDSVLRGQKPKLWRAKKPVGALLYKHGPKKPKRRG